MDEENLSLKAQKNAAISQLASLDPESLGETDTTIEEMSKRLLIALKFLKDIVPDSMNGSADRRIEIQLRIGPLAMEGQHLLFHFSVRKLSNRKRTPLSAAKFCG